MSEPTASRFTDEYMAANRIEINDNAVQDGTAAEGEIEYYVLFDVAPGHCACGCGAEVTNPKRNFLPGHDQRLMGILVRAHREGLEVSWMSGGLMVSGTATDYAALVLGDAGVAKLARYIATEPKRKRGQRTTAAAAKAPEVVADPLPRRVKVGRWEYDVVSVERDGNGTIAAVNYRNARGEEMLARQFKIIG